MIAYLSLALPALLWLIFRITLPAGPFEMDHSGQPGTFYALMIVYQRFFYFVAGASAAGAVIARMGDKPEPAVLMIAAATCAMLFNGFLTLFYEAYLAKTKYTINRYALIMALGFSAILLLLAGVVQVVWAA